MPLTARRNTARLYHVRGRGLQRRRRRWAAVGAAARQLPEPVQERRRVEHALGRAARLLPQRAAAWTVVAHRQREAARPSGAHVLRRTCIDVPSPAAPAASPTPDATVCAAPRRPFHRSHGAVSSRSLVCRHCGSAPSSMRPSPLGCCTDRRRRRMQRPPSRSSFGWATTSTAAPPPPPPPPPQRPRPRPPPPSLRLRRPRPLPSPPTAGRRRRPQRLRRQPPRTPNLHRHPQQQPM